MDNIDMIRILTELYLWLWFHQFSDSHGCIPSC